MRENVPTFALVAALAMILGALVVLSLHSGPENQVGPVLVGLVGAVGTVVGVIGGFSQNKGSIPITPPGTSSELKIASSTEKT